MFDLLFWRKHRHSVAYIKFIDASHRLFQPATPATTIINSVQLSNLVKGFMFYIVPPVCKSRDTCIKTVNKSQFVVHILSMILC